MKKVIFLNLVFFICNFCLSQKCLNLFCQEISQIDIVKVNAKYEKEAMYFYDSNWKEFRKQALKQGLITGYKLQRTPIDSTNHFTIILITEYQDSVQHAKSEANFREIIKGISPNGPKFLNNIQRKEFVEFNTSYNTKTIAVDENRR
ncbi:MAG: hypothetical protein K2X26_10775 [Chitinophagaceae bacterium]|nr:hypothetical protein [Chitinophagaceae bacterium]